MVLPCPGVELVEKGKGKAMENDGEVRITFNDCSGRSFNAYPKTVRDTISQVQIGIQRTVLRSYPGAIATSGYRCQHENFRVRGLGHSLHLLGFARDFVGLPVGANPCFPGLKCIVESAKGVWHFEVNDENG